MVSSHLKNPGVRECARPKNLSMKSGAGAPHPNPLPAHAGRGGILETASGYLFILLLSFAVWAHAAEPLATATAEYRELDEVYTADGTVEAVKQSTVAAQISGRIVEVRFDVGDHVKKGEVIVRIDEREVSDALASTKAQLAQAQATLTNAQAHYERTRELFNQKFVSRAALDKALADYRAAQAQLEAATAVASQAATVKGFATVTAPYSGIVAARHVELGETVTPGKPSS